MEIEGSVMFELVVKYHECLVFLLIYKFFKRGFLHDSKRADRRDEMVMLYARSSLSVQLQPDLADRMKLAIAMSNSEDDWNINVGTTRDTKALTRTTEMVLTKSSWVQRSLSNRVGIGDITGGAILMPPGHCVSTTYPSAHRRCKSPEVGCGWAVGVGS